MSKKILRDLVFGRISYIETAPCCSLMSDDPCDSEWASR